MICPFANCNERYERHISYDSNGHVTKIESITRAAPSRCVGFQCPFYIPAGEISTTEECKRVNMMLGE